MAGFLSRRWQRQPLAATAVVPINGKYFNVWSGANSKLLNRNGIPYRQDINIPVVATPGGKAIRFDGTQTGSSGTDPHGYFANNLIGATSATWVIVALPRTLPTSTTEHRLASAWVGGSGSLSFFLQWYGTNFGVAVADIGSAGIEGRYGAGSGLLVNNSLAMMVCTWNLARSGDDRHHFWINGHRVTTAAWYTSGTISTGLGYYATTFLGCDPGTSVAPATATDLLLYADLSSDIGDATAQSLSANPWQLFAPQNSPIFYSFAAVGGAVTHATSGILAGAGAAVAGTAAHVAKHATSGVLAGVSAELTGSAARMLEHAASGILTGPSTTIAGTAEHVAKHATSGAIVGPSASVAGTVTRTRVHATDGAFSGTTAVIDGVADHAVSGAAHGASGAIVGAGALVDGTAAHIATHVASGVLAGQQATLSGTAAHIAVHATDGVLTGAAATIAGVAARTRQHLTAGELIAQGSIIVGQAQAGAITHSASGDLIAGEAEIDGTARRGIIYAPIPPGAIPAERGRRYGSLSTRQRHNEQERRRRN